MKQLNSDARKSIIIDIESDIEEIDEAYNSLGIEQLPLWKRMFLWKADVYTEFNKPKTRTH